MPDENQAPPPDLSESTVQAEPAGEIPETTDGRGLQIWLGVLIVVGVGGLLFGMQEMAGLAAVAGLFVASQAADIDPRWRPLYYLIAWIVPLAGAALACAAAFAIIQSGLTGWIRPVVLALSVVTALISLLSLWRPVSDLMVRLLFRQEPSHTLRLAARMIAVSLLLAIPGWFAFRYMMDAVFEDPSILLEGISFGGELIGYALLALASVGFMVRRDVAAALERLGVRPIPAPHLALIGIGVIAIYGLNAGADWLERMYFPALWASDQRFNEILVSGLGPGRVLLLGLSAGIGEEITLRGALQPKLGLVLTSLLFASLHVQYSWFGILVIFLLGMILGTIRSKSSTSVAIGVHVLYDILAVLSVQPDTV